MSGESNGGTCAIDDDPKNLRDFGTGQFAKTQGCLQLGDREDHSRASDLSDDLLPICDRVDY